MGVLCCAVLCGHVREVVDLPNSTAEDADDATVVETFGAVWSVREGIPLADDGLDGGGGGGGEIAELVGQADDEGAQGGWGELDEVDGDGTPDAADCWDARRVSLEIAAGVGG